MENVHALIICKIDDEFELFAKIQWISLHRLNMRLWLWDNIMFSYLLLGDAEKEYWSLLRGNQEKHRDNKGNQRGRSVHLYMCNTVNWNITFWTVQSYFQCWFFICSPSWWLGNWMIPETVISIILCRGGKNFRGGKHGHSRDNHYRGGRPNKAQKV